MQSKEAIKKYIEKVGANGHAIFKAKFISDMGFTDEFVGRYAVNHESGEGYKSTIFDTATGNPFKSCYGVYGLNFLYGIANDIGADTTKANGKFGRGSQAGCLCVAIEEKLGEMNDE